MPLNSPSESRAGHRSLGSSGPLSRSHRLGVTIERSRNKPFPDPEGVRRMHSASHVRNAGHSLLCGGLAALFVAATVGAKEPEANREGPSPTPRRRPWRRAGSSSARSWAPKDPRSHGGDGLGPVFNAQSCLDCHDQGGPGGGGACRAKHRDRHGDRRHDGGFRLRLFVPHGLRRGAVRILLRHRRRERVAARPRPIGPSRH